MDSDLRLKSFEALRALRDLAKNGQIDQPTLYKGLVALAFEFATGQEPTWVTKLLLDVPVSYYRDYQPQQMLDDPKYAQLCLELSKLLVLYGMADIGPTINQPPGIA